MFVSREGIDVETVQKALQSEQEERGDRHHRGHHHKCCFSDSRLSSKCMYQIYGRLGQPGRLDQVEKTCTGNSLPRGGVSSNKALCQPRGAQSIDSPVYVCESEDLVAEERRGLQL